MADQSPENQGNLPHAEHVQPGRHTKMSDCRMLVPSFRTRPNPTCFKAGKCKQFLYHIAHWFLHLFLNLRTKAEARSLQF
jgi:hypothetical protein